jgi:hypothetical protein
MISKKFSKTMNYLIILIKFKVSRFLCRSVYMKIHSKTRYTCDGDVYSDVTNAPHSALKRDTVFDRDRGILLYFTLLFQRTRTNDRGWVEFNNGSNLGIRISKGTLERNCYSLSSERLVDIKATKFCVEKGATSARKI